MRMDGVILQPVHLGALEDLHAVVDREVLELLQEQQRVDPIRSAIPDARRVALGAENFPQLARIVGALIGEADAFPALELGRDSLPATRAEPKEQRVLRQQSALNVMPADRVDDSLDA